ncbi:MAG TPA: hypothetical protein VGS61_03190 [Acidimicrobiales bacterium]|nr:hypothetical protein [Acidimicrobiales bacterium]
MRRARPLLIVGALATLALGLMGQGSASPDTTTTSSSTTTTSSSTTSTTAVTTTTIPVTPYGVGLATCTFVDRTRPLPDYETKPPSELAPDRTLVTEIRYPTPAVTTNPAGVRGARPAARTGGFPLVVFAHGYDVTPETYERLLGAWVRAGFVVAAPILPEASPQGIAEQPGVDTERDMPNEPADLAFVIHQVVGDSVARSRACSVLAGLVDGSAVAVAGHSDGAEVVAALVASKGRDPQHVTFASLRASLNLRAAIVMEGGELSPGPYGPSRSDPPTMVIQSAADRCNAPWQSTHFYASLGSDERWFVELLHAHHLPPYDATDPVDFRVVAAVTTEFLRLELDQEVTVAQLTSLGGASPGLARIFHDVAVPYIAAPKGPIYCGVN